MKIELDEEKLTHLGDSDSVTMLRRYYKVQGHERRYIVTTYFDDCALDFPGFLDKQRQHLDDEAQFVADNPLPKQRPQLVQK